MPFIDLQLGRSVPATVRRQLAARATDLIVDLLHKRREVTAVRVAEQAADAWCVGGVPLPEAACPVHGTIFITAGTNRSDEKAAFIAALHAALVDALDPLPEASYLVIHEVAADDWGYAGLTQAARNPGRR